MGLLKRYSCCHCIFQDRLLLINRLMLHANSVMVTTLKMTIKLKGVDTNNQCHNVYAKVVISDYVHTC